MELQHNDAFTLWKLLLQSITQHGDSQQDTRKTVELLNVTTILTDTDALTRPIEHLRRNNEWVYPNAQQIERAMLNKPSSSQQEYSYGPRLFGFNETINQIDDYIIPRLQNDVATRRACSIVMKSDDVTIEEGKPMTSVVAIDFKIRKKKLCATMILRSLDAYIGWPANCYQLFVLANYVAQHINILVGTLTMHATSAHVFDEYKGHITKLTMAK